MQTGVVAAKRCKPWNGLRISPSKPRNRYAPPAVPDTGKKYEQALFFTYLRTAEVPCQTVNEYTYGKYKASAWDVSTDL